MFDIVSYIVAAVPVCSWRMEPVVVDWKIFQQHKLIFALTRIYACEMNLEKKFENCIVLRTFMIINKTFFLNH